MLENSRRLVQLLNVYFRGVFFAPLSSNEKDIRFFSFPDSKEIEPYLTMREENAEIIWEWDLEKMLSDSKGKGFLSLFPRKSAPANEDWKQYYSWKPEENNSKKKGGIIRFFIEKDDHNFIQGFNQCAVYSQKIAEGINNTGVPIEDTKVPGSFFEALLKTGTYAEYREDIKEFRWDFTGLLENKPITIYEAYWRYAHIHYSIRLIGEGKYKQFFNNETGKFYIDIDIILKCISRALERYKDNMQYIPSSYEEFLKNYKQELYWSKQRKPGKYDREQIQTIKNYCGENEKYKGKTMPEVLSKLGLIHEKENFINEITERPSDKRTVNKVKELYRLITSYPEIKKELEDKVDIINELYRISFQEISLNEEVKNDLTGDSQKSELIDILEMNNTKGAHPDNFSKAHLEPIEDLLAGEHMYVQKERIEILLPYFQKQFDSGFTSYLIEEEPNIVVRDINNYFLILNARKSKDKIIKNKIKGKKIDALNLYRSYYAFSNAENKLQADKFFDVMYKIQKMVKIHPDKEKDDKIKAVLFPGEVIWS